MLYFAVMSFVLVLWFVALVDLIFTEERMPKKSHMRWMIVGLFLPGVGACLWLLVGRRRYKAVQPADELRALVYAGGGRGPARGPDDDDEFLRRIGAEIEARRRFKDGSGN
jgi:hypothetical protein